MKKNILITLSAYLITASLNAQTVPVPPVQAPQPKKGIWFKVGEFFLGMSGHSYEALETQISSLQMNTNNCLNMSTKLQAALGAREKDIQSCKEYERFKESPEARNIGFNVMDVLAAGCKGHIKLTKDRFGSNSSAEGQKTEEKDTTFESKFDQQWRSVQFTDEKKSIAADRAWSHYEKRIDLKLDSAFRGGQGLPSVVLGQMYEINDEKSGGTLEKGTYKYKYNITKNANSQLEVVMEGETREQWNHMPIGEKNVFKFSCVGKTLDELNAMASTPNKDDQAIKNKVFGQ